MTHGSLFTGIGGFDLAARSQGVETIWNCEINEFNRGQLKRHFTETKQYTNILDVYEPESVDIISGGFPCQNISIAASKKRDGVDGDKSGLWREMHRICESVRPKYIIIENSSAILSQGFEIILEAFAEIGYDAEWQTLHGYQFGAAQRRRRLYAIFYPSVIGDRMEEKQIFSRWNKPEYPTWRDSEPKVYGMAHDVPNRVAKHRALGNAVQPNVARYLFKIIKEHYNEYY